MQVHCKANIKNSRSRSTVSNISTIYRLYEKSDRIRVSKKRHRLNNVSIFLTIFSGKKSRFLFYLQFLCQYLLGQGISACVCVIQAGIVVQFFVVFGAVVVEEVVTVGLSGSSTGNGSPRASANFSAFFRSLNRSHHKFEKICCPKLVAQD